MTRLYLVIDDGSGEATVFALAKDAAHAVDRARPLLGYTAEEPGDLRAVCAETAKSEPTRKMLAHWNAIATDAMSRGESVQSVEDAINAMSAVVVSSLAERDRRIATASAEAALAEREACARDVVEGIPSYNTGGDASTRAFVDTFVARELERRRDRIRARTTPATLSTETLAAIAEARGLRVVEPGLLEGLEPPVLRWNEDHGTLYGAPWSLLLNETDFVIFLSRQIVLRREYADGTVGDVAANRRAAEAALRLLGVPFRVEDGGAK